MFGCDNAKLQSQAMAHGHVNSLSPGEARLTAAHQLRPPSMGRGWDYWVRQIEKAGLMPAKTANAAKSRPAPAKRMKPKTVQKKPIQKKPAKPTAQKRR